MGKRDEMTLGAVMRVNLEGFETAFMSLKKAEFSFYSVSSLGGIRDALTQVLEVSSMRDVSLRGREGCGLFNMNCASDSEE